MRPPRIDNHSIFVPTADYYPSIAMDDVCDFLGNSPKVHIESTALQTVACQNFKQSSEAMTASKQLAIGVPMAMPETRNDYALLSFAGNASGYTGGNLQAIPFVGKPLSDTLVQSDVAIANELVDWHFVPSLSTQEEQTFQTSWKHTILLDKENFGDVVIVGVMYKKYTGTDVVWLNHSLSAYIWTKDLRLLDPTK